MPPKRKGRKVPPKGKEAPAKGKKVTNATSTHIKDEEGDESEILKAVEKHRTGFLDFPDEVRHRIYLLTLVRSWEIMLPDRKEVIPFNADDEVPPVVLHEPAILATCRQVRSEALPVFYGRNRFSTQFALYGPKLVRQLGSKRTGMLMSLKACGTEQARWVTYDRFMHATVQHVNRLFEAAGGALRPDAVLVPIGHGASGGWHKLTDAKDFRVIKGDEGLVVEWAGKPINAAFNIFEI